MLHALKTGAGEMRLAAVFVNGKRRVPGDLVGRDGDKINWKPRKPTHRILGIYDTIPADVTTIRVKDLQTGELIDLAPE